MKPKNLVGQKFGTLTPIQIVGKNNRGRMIWKCQCECGCFKETDSDSLISGNTKSCGQCQRSTIEKELTGQRFGMLLVISKADNIGVKTAWNVKCDCGKDHIVKTMNLMNGKTKSCGCQVNYNRVDYSGRKFGRLTVIEKYARQDTHMWYLCKCNCGAELPVSSGRLIAGRTKSCGCLQKELASKRGKLLKGSLNPAWKGGVTDEDQRSRSTTEYENWRKLVLKRDKICQVCGDNQLLQVHHLYSFVDNTDKRYDIDNGITLCDTCHKIFHMEYGSGANTPAQFSQFKTSLGV